MAKDPKDNPFLAIAEGEDYTPMDSPAPEPEAELSPEPQDWRKTKLPEDEKFYGRLRGKSLEDADRVLRELEDEKRKAETVANNYERQLASYIAQADYWKRQVETAKPKEEPKPEPQLNVTVDDIAERPNEFAKLIIESVTSRILPEIDRRLQTSKTEVTKEINTQTVQEKLRDVTGRVFSTLGIPEADFRETFNELAPIIDNDPELKAKMFDDDTWLKAVKKRKEIIASRYRLQVEPEEQQEAEPQVAAQAPQPQAAPAPKPRLVTPNRPSPQGNFGPAGQTPKISSDTKVSQADRDRFEPVGKAMGLSGEELEGFILDQANIKKGLRAARKNLF